MTPVVVMAAVPAFLDSPKQPLRLIKEPSDLADVHVLHLLLPVLAPSLHFYEIRREKFHPEFLQMPHRVTVLPEHTSRKEDRRQHDGRYGLPR